MSPLRSWFSIPRGSHFSLANLPFGIISTASNTTPRVAVAIGEHALDLQAFAAHNGFSDLSTIQPHQSVFSEPSLNAFAALGRPVHSVVRKYLQSVFLEDTPYPAVLKTNSDLQKQSLFPLKEVQTHLPFRIGDYTDFFAGLNHAYNCGVIFRGPSNALQPNYKHLPVGYHGRASSVVVSGTPIRRPNGQILLDPTAEKKVPTFSPCKKLDIELELGAFVCRSNKQGEPVPIGEAEQSLFGIVLMNDWSARDIQAWEYVPLGPFNAKNFGTTISAWVVHADALAPFKAKGLENDQDVLPYLREKDEKSVYDIKLQVDLKTSSGNTSTITQTNARNLLWSFPQMLTHHSITGCNFQPGDLLGSGTISGTSPSECGSFLEQSDNGKNSIKIQGGEERKFLQDGDVITITGVCGSDEEALVGFGECVAQHLCDSKLTLSINRFLFKNWPDEEAQRKNYTQAIESSLENPDIEPLKVVKCGEGDDDGEMVAHLVMSRVKPRKEEEGEEQGEKKENEVPPDMQPEIFNWVMDAITHLGKPSKDVEHLQFTHSYVVPSSRNQGIEAALIQVYLDRAKQAELPVFLSAEPQDLPLFLEMGFQETGRADIDLSRFAPEACGWGVFRLTGLRFTG